MSAVAVYNAGGTEVLQFVTPKHARRMLYRRVARAVGSAAEGGIISAVELLRYVFPKWQYSDKVRHYSKRGVLHRDNQSCAYCSGHATTVDHVVPRCQGGRSVWENVVASCFDCNSRKGGRTPAQAGMTLRVRPVAPR